MTQPVKMAAEYANHDLWNLKRSSAGAKKPSTCCFKKKKNVFKAAARWVCLSTRSRA